MPPFLHIKPSVVYKPSKISTRKLKKSSWTRKCKSTVKIFTFPVHYRANRDVNEVCFGDTMSLTSGRMELYILVLLAFVSYLNKHEQGALTRSIKSLPVPIAGCCYGNANFKPQSPPVILTPRKFRLFIN